VSLIQIKLIAGLVLLVSALAGAWAFVTYERRVGADALKEQIAKSVAEQQQLAAKATAQMQEQADANTKAEKDRADAITVERDALLVKLRNRPPSRPNLPASAAAACAGAIGADLSQPSSDLLVNAAAEADNLRSKYDELYDFAAGLTCQPQGK
jgi:hypothetical protein